MNIINFLNDLIADSIDQINEKVLERLKECSLEEKYELEIIKNITTLVLTPDNKTQLYSPKFVLQSFRSAILEDFQENELNFLKIILDHVENRILKARIADIIWIISNPREIKFAITAIENYIEFCETFEAINGEALNIWKRSFQLAESTNKPEFIIKIKENIYKLFQSTISDANFYHLKASKILLSSEENKNKIIEILNALENIAYSKQQENYFLSISILEEISSYHKFNKDLTKFSDYQLEIFNIYQKEINKLENNQNSSYFQIRTILESSIATLRKIPRKQRKRLNVDELLKNTFQEYTEVRIESTSELKSISNFVDLSEVITSCRNAISNKSKSQAFKIFVNIINFPNLDNLERIAKLNLKKNPLLSIFSEENIANDGRVISRANRNLTSEMIRLHLENINLNVQAYIFPALGILNLEHNYTEIDISKYIHLSPLIPFGKHNILAHGLTFGFLKDFSTSLHILTPLLENIIRFQLQLHNVKTTTLDPEGIETEVGLSKLMEKKEIIDIFGKELKFEIEALFSSNLGPNLRNQIAHGLANASLLNSTYSIYGWWLILKIIVNSNPEFYRDDSA
ncbi:conserved hypothetical protein [Leptospira biflexa serovar Patoc strain 'Patoc 1 (Ames)']|uniref:Uncharacterized protein n=1 Tax=Leptospira biflexa serovar Patoc (strain Patoc 1 / ATCC 23582 / Paris) TaxID=456481 RepID=B0ST52_LEPBP|nr:DUF4209 domain-containing protein [Leptospira biflexa]ABZ94629.1 conserved hypothetical protein [Leptospira biflexa serovar Patoc strain 'Patoc 1 (Ames)']ABZ98292.1 Hypothetical protein LEPBI_I2193 [Leptospira biflexa serovar Patoc strain 'Patoc 1 (Paris)']